MATGLDWIERACPAWFRPTDRSNLALFGEARVGPWRDGGLELMIRDGVVSKVSETTPGSALPRCCPDRHIEGDGTFCLGLGRVRITSRRLALAWWSRLEQFLACQAAAARSRVWPLDHSLDHGHEAGEWHRRAKRLSERLGIADVYADAWLGEPSWLTGWGLTKLGERRRGARPPTGSRRKPRVRQGRRGRLALLELVIVERARRRAISAFWTEIKRMPCCGSMRDCRLKAAPPQRGGTT